MFISVVAKFQVAVLEMEILFVLLTYNAFSLVEEGTGIIFKRTVRCMDSPAHTQRGGG